MDRIKHWLHSINEALAALFDIQKEDDFPWLRWVWIGAIFLAGLIAWGFFFNWGAVPLEFMDWAEVWGPRLQAWRYALQHNTLPLHLGDLAAMRSANDRYFAVADMISSPQVILLRFMEVGPYALVNNLLLYALATWSLLKLRQRFKLSLAAFTPLFFLFHFNGFLVSHLSVGHLNWGGYYLFPAFALLVFQLLDGDRSWRWVAKMALVLFGILLQGSYHHFAWCLIFLGVLGLVSWRSIPALAKAAVSGVLISLPRLLPPLTVLTDYTRYQSLGGYSLIRYIPMAMVFEVPPEGSLPFMNFFGDLKFSPWQEALLDPIRSKMNWWSDLGYWEYDIYVGLLGFLFIALFAGLYLLYRHAFVEKRFPVVLVPTAAILLLTIRDNFRTAVFDIPFLIASERVSARMIGLVLAVGIILAALYYQKWLSSTRQVLLLRLVQLALILWIGYDMIRHALVWSVINSYQAFEHMSRDFSQIVVSNHTDPPYIFSLAIGVYIALLAGGALYWLVQREKKLGIKEKTS